MSFMDKLRSWFGVGSSNGGDAHAGHDHSHDHAAHDVSAPPAPAADPVGTPTSEPAAADDDEDQPA